jgi:hypothetical protein
MIEHRMRRVTAVAVLSLSLTASISHSRAQNARQRQAAAEAYDRGTTAYVDQAYGEAARWFETANRLAPAAPALMQAIRAHERNDNAARATTLALELQTSYRDDNNAANFAHVILDKNSPSFVRVQVACDEDCKLDVDGKLEEHLTFFVVPDVPHALVATFETGSQSEQVQGAAGETKDLSFTAPPAPPVPALSLSGGKQETTQDRSAKPPLPPLFTWIGIGVTVALGAATIISAVDAKAGVPEYEKAASMSRDCVSAGAMNCSTLEAHAAALLDAGQSRETRTNILIGVTAAAAVGTGVLAFALTDWSGGSEREHNTASRAHTGLRRLALRVEPRLGGATTVLEGRF